MEYREKFLKEGLTYDDVLLIPAEHPHYDSRHGHGDRVGHGHCHCP